MNGTQQTSRAASAARFEDDRVWRLAARTWSDLRIQAMCDLVDPATASVLEVGCGDGAVARAVGAKLGPGVRLVGLDRARPGLVRFSAIGPALRGDIDALPLAAASCDLVIASEVLEHLPDPVLAAAARELMRVARRDLLVSVPDREDLARERMRCDRCGGFFNAFGHVQSFALADLDRLFAGWTRVGATTAGPRRRYHPLLLALRHRVGLYGYDASAVCSHCGNAELPNREHHPVRLVCDFVNTLTHLRKREGYWVIARYRRPAP
ncbi:MAG TPA: class I SAM-dependent methyltransferase [Polyangia bacterium]|jgi:SAM-dependent methyltransferase